ncbi:hypothetical protein TDB9533_03159 [Thalassocella blandensis]|nr:hypothetical protein TDB9533_03159 [Thalassocella blandensis]
MTDQTQQTSREAETRRRSRAPEPNTSESLASSVPAPYIDTLPVSSVPQYMSGPISSMSIDPRASTSTAGRLLDASASSELDGAASRQSPPDSSETSTENSEAGTSDAAISSNDATSESPLMSVGGTAPEGGIYDDSLQQCLPEQTSDTEGGETETEDSQTGDKGQEKKQKKQPLPTPLIARTGNIQAPRVPSPPAAAIKRRTQIQQQTGDTPEMHQAKIQVAVLRVVDAARDSQRQIVWRVGNLASDTRKSFEEIAQDIMAFTSGCIMRVQEAVTVAKEDITTAVDLQIAHFAEMKDAEQQEQEKSREEIQQEVMDRLIEHGSELETAHTALQEEFAPYLEEAKCNIENIEENGAAFPLSPPEGTAALEPSTDSPPTTSDAANGPQQTMLMATQELESVIEQKQGTNALGYWYGHRMGPVLEVFSERRKTELHDTLVAQATALDSYTLDFSKAAMGLSLPMAQSFRNREIQTKSTAEQGTLDARHRLAVSTGEHGDTLMHKFDGVIAYLDEDLQPQLVDGLRKAGHQAAEAFRDQGKMSERMMNNTAASLAAAYPELVFRVAEMLPEGEFLNEQEVGPRLKAAWESSRRLPDQQFAQMEIQASETLAQARESARTQMGNLAETADKSVQQVQDTVTATKFDFDSFGYQVTGRMREGGWNSIIGARAYAQRMADKILSSRDKENGALANLLRSFVITLNSSINNAGKNYFSAVEGFKGQMTSENDGVFTKVEAECDKMLSEKSQKLDENLTAPDPDVTTGLVVLNVATLGLTTGVTAGYLIYNDADDDDIFSAIGDLQWPAQPALEYYFNSTKYGNKGNLFRRFDQCLSVDAASRAKGLFSSDHTTRFNARRDSIKDSLGIFVGLNSDARRSLTQGMDEEEREAAGDDAVNTLVSEINDSWSAYFQSDAERRMDEGYLRGDMGMVLSARIDQSLTTARRKGSDEIFQSIQGMEQMARDELARSQSSLAITPHKIQELTNDAIQDFAERRPENKGKTLTEEQAQQSFFDYVTADRVVVHGETVQHIPVDQQIKDYVRSVVDNGWEDANTLATEQAYEFTRAENSYGGPSETDTNRITRAFEYPELASLEQELREHPDRADQLTPQIAKLREKQEERMQAVVSHLNPAPTQAELEAAGGATEYMAQRTARMFSGGTDYNTSLQSGDRRSDTQAYAQYGYELIHGGRASLTAGIFMASNGCGTNEDLLKSTFQNRTRSEVDQARTDWQSRYSENLDEYLGIQHRTPEQEANGPVVNWFQGGEVSGDLANEIQELARGNPESDQDYIELAVLRYQQQRRRGTGSLGSFTMSGTDEAQTIDSHYGDMGQILLDEARRRREMRMSDPNYSGEAIPLPENPEDVFTHDGRINPAVAGLVFVPGPSRDGQESPPIFGGDRSNILGRSRQVSLAGDRYKSELDRQESLMLAGITALAIAATVILMACGVGFVLASIIVALGAGLMTMAVKSGMRGERYGWEEAAVDAASTAVEVAAAGAGGAIAKGMGPAAQITGTMSKMGAALEGTFGRFGGMVAREAIIGTVSTAANTALQDDTYKDGPGAAFGKILLGGIKGGAISAVSGAVSEKLGDRINNRLIRGLDDVADASRLSGLGRNLGANGRNILKEGVAEGLGGMAGEATGILIEVSSGTYKGGLGDALKRMGQAGLKDMVSAAGRAGATAYGVPGMRKRQYQDLLAEARRSGDLSESDLNVLRLAAKAAGEKPPSMDEMRNRIQSDQHMLNQLPPEVRVHAEGMDSNSLRQLVGMIQGGELAKRSDNRRDLLAQIAESNPRIPIADLLRGIDNTSQKIRKDNDGDSVDVQTAQNKKREQMLQNLPDSVRKVLQDIPMQGLEHLPDSELPRLNDAMTRGKLNAEDVDAILRSARQANPELDSITFLKNLNSAVQSAKLAQQAHARILQKQRTDVLKDVNDSDATLFARLGDDDLKSLRSAMDTGELSAQRLNSLYEAALKIDPSLDRTQFEASVRKSLDNAQQRQQGEAQQKRQQREKVMENIPESLRSVLSVLPDSALLELRITQMQGELSPADRRKFIDLALKQDPKLDLSQFNKALDATIAHNKNITRHAEDSQALRNELKAMAPPEQRHLLNNVPILVMSDAEFKVYAQSDSGNAVTVILNGKPVVIIREGANPRVLREEGIHALQAQDPGWSKKIGSLNENQLQRWDELPVDVQVALYRNKLELEINAHDRMVENLADRLRKSDDPEEQNQLRMELELAQRTLDNLTKRMAEVEQLSPLVRMQMQAGLIPRPQYLDQPARMFNKANTEADGILAEALKGANKGKKVKQDLEEAIGRLKPDDLAMLKSLDLTSSEMRRVLLKSDASNVRSLLDNIDQIQKSLKEGHPELYQTIMSVVTTKRHDVHALAQNFAKHIASGDSNAIRTLSESGLETRSILNILAKSDSFTVAIGTIEKVCKLSSSLPEAQRAQWVEKISKLEASNQVVADLHVAALQINDANTVAKLCDALLTDTDKSAAMADTIKEFVSSASPQTIKAFIDSGIDSYQLSQILRSDLSQSKQIETIGALVDLSSRLNAGDRASTLAELARKKDFVELVNLLHTATKDIGDAQAVNQLLLVTSMLTVHHKTFAENLVVFMGLADADTKLRLADALSKLSPELAASTMHAFNFAVSKTTNLEHQKRLTNLVTDSDFKQTFREFRKALEFSTSDQMTKSLIEVMLQVKDNHQDFAKLLADFMKNSTPDQQSILDGRFAHEFIHDILIVCNNSSQASNYIENYLDIHNSLPASLQIQAQNLLHSHPGFPSFIPSIRVTQTLMGDSDSFLHLISCLPRAQDNSEEIVNSLNRALKSASSTEISDINKRLSELTKPADRLQFVESTIAKFGATKLKFERKDATFENAQLATLSKADAALLKTYLDLVYSNKGKWSWDDVQTGLSDQKRSEIRNLAKKLDLVPDIYVDPKTKYAAFEQYLIHDLILPQHLWAEDDKTQFDYLNDKIGGAVPGYTWHHHQDDGRMILIPTGLHKIYGHKGGRSPGHWGEDGRP